MTSEDHLPSSSETDAPMTIKVLRDNGQRLGVRCADCHRFRYMADRRFQETETLENISADLKCARCGSENIAAEAVSRDARTGFWPAEGS